MLVGCGEQPSARISQIRKDWQAHFSIVTTTSLPQFQNLERDIAFAKTQLTTLNDLDTTHLKPALQQEWQELSNAFQQKIQELETWKTDAASQYDLLPWMQRWRPTDSISSHMSTAISAYQFGKQNLIPLPESIAPAIQQQGIIYVFIKENYFDAICNSNLPEDKKQQRLRETEALLLEIKDFIGFLKSQYLLNILY